MPKAIRRKLIVKKDFQAGLFMETTVLMFFVAVIVGWTVYLGVFKTILFDLGGEKITLINNFISLRMLYLFLPTVFAILVISIFLSHQVAGPVFVFQRTINSLLAGKPVRKIILRENDKLHDFAEDINKLIDYFEARQGENNQDIQSKSDS